jgi:hypothetical protein
MSFGSLVSWPNRRVGPDTIPALAIVDAKAEESEHKQMLVTVTQHLLVLVLAELIDERQKKLARETGKASLNIDRQGAFKKSSKETTMPPARQ